jgi:hypothetical protein
MTEAAFQKLVLDAARLFGWLWYHTRDSRGSAAGYPDLTLVRVAPGKPPRVLFVELKSATGRLRAEQIVWATTLGAVGGAVEHHVWRPTTSWETIQEVLR